MKLLIIFAVALFSGVYSQNNVYRRNNAYRQGNSYAEGNAYAQGNVYPQGKGYSQGNPAAGSVYRPCPNFNRNCISQYFARNSNCRIVNGQNAREPFYAPFRIFELPSFNASLTRYDSEYFNILSGRIEEFFVDYASGNTVLSVDFRNLTISAGVVRYETHRRANIPLVEITSATVSYPEISITTVFPSSNQLNLAQVRSTAFINLSPDLRADIVGVAFTAINKNLVVHSQEIFLTTAPLTARNYIQSTICDFGIGPNDLGADR